ncbi:MAG: transcription elongation factor GreA, partial [Actinomycetota bacterium]|nr:transcription elongation factor GreA [Actinomycetota bacterium]
FMTSSKTWLTPTAYQKLREEVEYLETEGRSEIERRIADARDHGDLRENAEYDTAKNDQGMMEARIRQIRSTLDSADVREIEDSGRVEVGTVATVVDEKGDETEFLVAPAENKVPGLLLASPDSPLGGALLGAAPGETITYQAPGGTFTYTVRAVRVYEG